MPLILLQTDLALETLERVAAENKQPMILGRLTVDEDFGHYSASRCDILVKIMFLKSPSGII